MARQSANSSLGGDENARLIEQISRKTGSAQYGRDRNAKLLQFESKAARNPEVLQHGKVLLLKSVSDSSPDSSCSMRQIGCETRQRCCKLNWRDWKPHWRVSQGGAYRFQTNLGIPGLDVPL